MDMESIDVTCPGCGHKEKAQKMTTVPNGSRVKLCSGCNLRFSIGPDDLEHAEKEGLMEITGVATPLSRDKVQPASTAKPRRLQAEEEPEKEKEKEEAEEETEGGPAPDEDQDEEKKPEEDPEEPEDRQPVSPLVANARERAGITAAAHDLNNPVMADALHRADASGGQQGASPLLEDAKRRAGAGGDPFIDRQAQHARSSRSDDPTVKWAREQARQQKKHLESIGIYGEEAQIEAMLKAAL
jgi:hypothetical protein